MVISIIQPCFVPWLGYFEQIALADIFAYMDDVQYTRKDWRNGNQLKSPYGVKNIFFPVKKAPRETLINDIEISYNQPWEDALVNQLSSWYEKSTFFNEIMEVIRPHIYHKYVRLLDLNFHLNNAILKYLDIQTPIFLTSDIPRRAQDKNERVLEICKHFEGVDLLYDGKKARDFIDIEYFRLHGIQVIFQDYQQTPYPQLWGKFVPYMSIVDLLMNCGRESKKIILRSPVPKELQRPPRIIA